MNETIPHRRRVRRAMGTDLAEAYRSGSRVERACYQVAALLVLSGLFHLGVLLATGGPWTGPLSWRKPATFGLSFGLTLATLTWVLSFVPLRARTRSRLLSVFGAACVVEVAGITTQAWRRVPSHFTAPGDATAADAVAAVFAASGALKPGHAATMHGVLVLPALAWLLRLADRPERVRTRIIRLACTGYAAFAGVVVVATLLGIDPTSGLPAALALAGALILAAATTLTLHAITRPPKAPRA